MSDTHDRSPEPVTETDAELFIEFANRSRLAPVGDPDLAGDLTRLADWLTANDLAGARPRRARLEEALPAFRELRALVRDVGARVDGGAAPTRAQVSRINRFLREGLHYHALRSQSGGATFSMEPVGDELDQARARIAGSLAHYLADHEHDRLRVCADDGCRWLFIDRSPAGRRRWCDMRTCGNRAKVARHRARQRQSQAAS